jgi:hypothetical protein
MWKWGYSIYIYIWGYTPFTKWDAAACLAGSLVGRESFQNNLLYYCQVYDGNIILAIHQSMACNGISQCFSSWKTVGW